MRGYFAMGIVGVTKDGNMGNLIRTAHGFGASFAFAINPQYRTQKRGQITMAQADTAKSGQALPYYEYPSVDEMQLPQGCQLVGIELTDDAVDLPSFRHPLRAAYILGAEREDIPADVLAQCDHVIKIPTRFCLNVATAGAIVMYDRVASMGGFAKRAVFSRGIPEALPEHVSGDYKQRKKDRAMREALEKTDGKSQDSE